MSDFNDAQQKQIDDFKNWSPSADPDWVQAVLDTVISISDSDMDTITTDLDNNPDFGPEDTPYFVDKNFSAVPEYLEAMSADHIRQRFSLESGDNSGIYITETGQGLVVLDQ